MIFYDLFDLWYVVSRLFQNKAIAEDFCEDSVLWKQILNKDNEKIAKIFIHLWDSKITDSKDFERHLTGILVPLKQVHPKPDEYAYYCIITNFKISRI